MAASWWLYGQDLALAQELQHRAITTSQQRDLLLANISILSYLGDYDGCAHWLDQVGGRRDVIGRQSDYRLRRFRRVPNPWRALLEAEQEDSLCATIDSKLQEGHPVVVDLVGGIGDQLENAALLLNIQTQLKQIPALSVRALGENAGIVTRLLEQVDGLTLLSQANQDHAQWRITAPWFRYWLGRCGIRETIRRPLLDGARVDGSGRDTLLVCWRTKPDAMNPLSSFSRSLPFARIIALLDQWRGAAQRRGLQLIDISDYTPDEARVMQTSHGGWVTLARQQLNSLQDTLRLMQRAEAIATVDTSLGHLAVLCRRQVNLLLPLWPDERWYDLLADGLYRELTTVHQQTRFHSWDEPLTALSRVLQLTR